MKNKTKQKNTSNSKKNLMQKIEEQVLLAAIEIAKEGEGALFFIGDKINYEKLHKQKFEQFNVLDKGAVKLLEKYAIKDGAVIIDRSGNVLAYGVLIKNTRPFVGYGTRHAAGITASKGNNVCVLCSEEERKVKIFKNGKYIMQLDALDKNILSEISDIATLFETVGAGFLGTLGTVVLAPTLGIALIPGVVIFGSSYLMLKKAISKIQKQSKRLR